MFLMVIGLVLFLWPLFIIGVPKFYLEEYRPDWAKLYEDKTTIQTKKKG